jgi:hypothetical protein
LTRCASAGAAIPIAPTAASSSALKDFDITPLPETNILVSIEWRDFSRLTSAAAA